MRYALSVLLALLLCGCIKWSHESRTEQEFYVDMSECEGRFASMANRMDAAVYVERCMMSRGWKQGF